MSHHSNKVADTEYCPLKHHAEGRRTYDLANWRGMFPGWDALSEASRAQWMHCLTSAAFSGSLDEVLK